MLALKGSTTCRSEGLLLCLTIMSFDDCKMEGESVINIKLHPKLWIFNAKGIHQLIIDKVSIQFNHNHITCNGTLSFHLLDGCQESIFVNGLVNSSKCIVNMSLIIMTNH
jgi:hypothetical protein